MCTVFWVRKGVILMNFTPRNKTANATAYGEALKNLWHAFKKKDIACLVMVLFCCLTMTGHAPLMRHKISLSVLVCWTFYTLKHLYRKIYTCQYFNILTGLLRCILQSLRTQYHIGRFIKAICLVHKLLHSKTYFSNNSCT